MHSTLDIEQSSKHAIQIERKKNMKCWKGRKEEMKWKQSSNKDSRAMMERGNQINPKKERPKSEHERKKLLTFYKVCRVLAACSYTLTCLFRYLIRFLLEVHVDACIKFIYDPSQSILYTHIYLTCAFEKQQTRKRRVNALCVQNRFVEL